MTAQGSWLRCYQPRPAARVRLVCLPHAGGAASLFRHWPRHLPAAVELHAVQYPGREDRIAEPCPTGMRELAEHAAGAVTPLLDRPVALFGHSMGAAVAFEVAARLQERRRPGQHPLAHLFASARHAPQDTREGAVHLRDDAGLVAELRRLGGTSDLLLDDPDLRSVVLPAVRADYRLIETYRDPDASRTLDCPVTVTLGDRDPEVTLTEAGAWSKRTRGSFDLVAFPGGHFYLQDTLPALTAALAERLDLPRQPPVSWPSTP